MLCIITWSNLQPSASRSGRAESSYTVITFQNVQLKGLQSQATFSSDLKAAVEKTVDITVKELENRI